MRMKHHFDQHKWVLVEHATEMHESAMIWVFVIGRRDGFCAIEIGVGPQSIKSSVRTINDTPAYGYVHSLGLNGAICRYRSALGHHTLTQISVDLPSVRSTDNHLKAISQEIPKPPITRFRLKTTYNRTIFTENPQGDRELIFGWSERSGNRSFIQALK